MKFKIFRASDSKKIWEIEVRDIKEIVELSRKSKWRNSKYSEGIIINGDTIEIYDDYRE